MEKEETEDPFQGRRRHPEKPEMPAPYSSFRKAKDAESSPKPPTTRAGIRRSASESDLKKKMATIANSNGNGNGNGTNQTIGQPSSQLLSQSSTPNFSQTIATSSSQNPVKQLLKPFALFPPSKAAVTPPNQPVPVPVTVTSSDNKSGAPKFFSRKMLADFRSTEEPKAGVGVTKVAGTPPLPLAKPKHKEFISVDRASQFYQGKTTVIGGKLTTTVAAGSKSNPPESKKQEEQQEEEEEEEEQQRGDDSDEGEFQFEEQSSNYRFVTPKPVVTDTPEEFPDAPFVINDNEELDEAEMRRVMGLDLDDEIENIF